MTDEQIRKELALRLKTTQFAVLLALSVLICAALVVVCFNKPEGTKQLHVYIFLGLSAFATLVLVELFSQSLSKRSRLIGSPFDRSLSKTIPMVFTTCVASACVAAAALETSKLVQAELAAVKAISLFLTVFAFAASARSFMGLFTETPRSAHGSIRRWKAEVAKRQLTDHLVGSTRLQLALRDHKDASKDLTVLTLSLVGSDEASMKKVAFLTSLSPGTLVEVASIDNEHLILGAA